MNLGYGHSYEAQMMKNYLQTMARNASQLNAALDAGDSLPLWTVTSVGMAKDRLTTATDYLLSRKKLLLKEEAMKGKLKHYGDIREDVERERTLKQHTKDIIIGSVVAALTVVLSDLMLEAIRGKK